MQLKSIEKLVVKLDIETWIDGDKRVGLA